MSAPQQQGSQGTAQPQQQMQLLKADDVAKLQHLNDDAKQKYRPVLQNFWNMIQSKPQGSPEYTQARQKLQEWSAKLIQQERQHRAKMKQLGQPSQPASQASNESQQQQAQPQQAQKPQPTAQAPNANQQQQQQQQQQRPQQGQGQTQFNPEIIKHVSAFQYHLPPQGPPAGTPEAEAKIKEMRNQYLMALNKQEKATHRVRALQNLIESRQKTGQEIPPELITQKQTSEKEYNAAKEFVDGFRKRQAQWKAENEARRAQQQSQGQAQAQSPQQPQQQPGQAQRRPSQPVVKEEPQIKVEGGQPQQPQQPQQQFTNMPGGTPQQTQPQQGGQVPAPSLPQQQQLRQPPAPHSQQQNAPPQFAQPQQPQAHQQPRPQINPHQANVTQSQQTNSPHPQSATSNPTGPPVPLSHQAAVSAAQRSYSNPDPQRTTTPMQPGGHGNFQTPGSREREQLNNPKMPIPRTLNVTQPAPVGMGQARPTMSGPTNGAPGQMGQPVINKFPPFQLEGEGDRVLSKRKLDELVRQVTGGSEEALTPEVEEAILQLADDFVDTVISNACKLSKLRESPQLDIRDIQLVLERNYNIRIPGYASDEVRTVRKLVPAPGWTQKMNAVQAAKVMGGKTDI